MIEERKVWLEDAILMYLKNPDHVNPDSIDICHHFKLRVDITLASLKQLCEDGKARRVNLVANKHYYESINRPDHE